MKKNVFTLQEVAETLRVNPRTIFRLIKGENIEGRKLPATKVGRSWRIAGNDLKKYLMENVNVRNTVDFEQMITPVKRKKTIKTKNN